MVPFQSMAALHLTRQRFASQHWENGESLAQKRIGARRLRPRRAEGGAMSKILGLILTAIVLGFMAGGVRGQPYRVTTRR
jgi:hypothetical protein